MLGGGMGEVGDLLADGLGAAFKGGFLGAALDAWAGEGPGGRCWCLHRRVVVGVGVVVLIWGCGAVLDDFMPLRGSISIKIQKRSVEKVNTRRLPFGEMKVAAWSRVQNFLHLKL